MITRLTLAAAVLASIAAGPVGAQARYRPAAGYRSSAELARALDSLQRARSDLIRVSEIARSPGGRPVSLIRLGAGRDVDERPAVLLVANGYGPDLVGSEIAIRAAATLAAGYGRDTAVTRLLDRVTFYLVPRANPDAAEALFGTPAVERAGNDTPADDDRDDATGEDGPDDLDGNGLITMMRIPDPAGEWMTDPLEPALLRRADRKKGETGRFTLVVEGRDDDGDESYNEDGPGGTDISRNYPHGYAWFAPTSGAHQLSADESRAIVDLFRERTNIAALYVIGQHDNLLQPWEFKRVPGISGNPQGTSAGGPFTTALPEDEPWYAEMSRRFKRVTGWSDPPPATPFGGDLASFGYFGLGRLAFAARGWWIPKMAGDTSRSVPKPPSPDPIATERNAHAWLAANRPEALIPWRQVSLPSSPRGGPAQQVEVGGFAPGALLNPPPALLDSVAAKHTAFLAELGRALPSVALRDVRIESLGSRVFRISALVANDGFFPTVSAIGARVRWPRRVKVELVTSGSQSISAGSATQLLDPIEGSGGSRAVSWVVVGDPGSTVTLRAGSPVAGTAVETLTLRPRQP